MLVQVFHSIFGAIVWFWSKSCEPFVVNIDSERIYTRNKNINSQIKFVTIYQKWVRNVFTNNGFFIRCYDQLRQVINNVDTSSLRTLRWFNNPKIIFFQIRNRIFFVTFSIVVADAFLNLEKSLLKQSSFLWQLVRLRSKIELTKTKFGFHVCDIFRKPVFTGQFCWVLKMIYLLIVLHLFIDLLLILQTNACPKNIPFVLICLLNTLWCQNRF